MINGLHPKRPCFVVFGYKSTQSARIRTSASAIHKRFLGPWTFTDPDFITRMGKCSRARAQQFSLWPLRSAPGSLGTYGFLTPPYGLPYGLELKNNPRLCTSLRVYASNTPQEAAILILEASKRELPGSESQNENCCRFADGREFNTQDYTERHKSLRRVRARGVISVVEYSEPNRVICWIKPRNRVQ